MELLSLMQKENAAVMGPSFVSNLQELVIDELLKEFERDSKIMSKMYAIARSVREHVQILLLGTRKRKGTITLQQVWQASCLRKRMVL